jgi:hypothetical protein
MPSFRPFWPGALLTFPKVPATAASYSTTSTMHGSFHPSAPAPESHFQANVLAINRLNKK